ncbi:MAG: hypothetical protein HY097_04645, partial [Nitrospinae bacterium]|nr:hypothetical protein [Nitrospinota bacterium]
MVEGEGGGEGLLSLLLPLPSGDRLSLLLPLPFGERIEVRGIPSLFSAQSAEAYTHQDVENAYNNAKAQYPNDKIWIEEVNQNGQNGYKIWKRPNNSLWKETIEYTKPLKSFANTNNTSCNCPYTDWRKAGDACYFDDGWYDGITYWVWYADITTNRRYGCDGSILSEGGGPIREILLASGSGCYKQGSNDFSNHLKNVLSSVQSPPPEEIIYNCKSYDILLAEFIPVDLCLDKTTGNYVPCLQNCKDPVTGAPAVEICGNGIDDNCNGQIDEGCCQDKDGDGYYAISSSCPQGNDCDDNDPTITVLQINSFTADKTTTNPSAGETVTLSGSITGGGNNPSWTI